MKYLSFDLEATGLGENDLIIEFGMIPFDTSNGELAKNLGKHFFVKCPSFEELKPKLDPWVVEHNEELIRKAHAEGLTMDEFKQTMEDYFSSKEVKDYFDHQRIYLFGKSLNAIDLPFLNRDLGWDFMRKYFFHQQLDLSSAVLSFIDMGMIPPECNKGSGLMSYLNMGEVAHTAMEDAENTAIMYLKLLERFRATSA